MQKMEKIFFNVQSVLLNLQCFVVFLTLFPFKQIPNRFPQIVQFFEGIQNRRVF